jgi:hypothetical protein
MSNKTETRKEHPRTSRERYRRFVEDYKKQRLDDTGEDKEGPRQPDDAG